MKILRQLLTTPIAELGRAGRALVRQYRFWSHCFALLRKNRAQQLAAALSYYTIFGIVPLAIVVVLIFHSIPSYRQTGDQFKKIMYNELQLTKIEYPDPEDPERRIALTDYLDGIIDHFFASVDRGSVGVVSALLLVWAALRLLSLIEGAFNHTWHVSRGRGFVHRVINYWALLTLLPLLLGAGLYLTTKYVILGSIWTGILGMISPVISYVMSALALFLLYLVMPNAKVRVGAALWGAAVAALVWGLARLGFGIYVTKLIPYSAIYGVLGLIPLAVFWVYITWLIVLFGLELAFVIQNFETLEKTDIPKAKGAQGRFIANDMTAIAVAREIAVAFEGDRSPVSTDDICSRLDIPGEFGETLLDELVRRNLLARVSEPRRGFVPIRDPEHIKLSEIAEAMAAVAFAQPHADEHSNLNQIAQAQRSLLAQHNLKETLDARTTAADEPGQIPKEPPAENQGHAEAQEPPQGPSRPS